MPSMTVILLTISNIILRRQMAHNSFVANPRPSNGTSFDYIIVGGGTAGCVLAGRLANARNVSVLLLEAGGPQSIITDMPGNTLFLVGGDFDWNYHVVPQQSAGLAYPNFFFPRGQVLGGSSTTNWDIYNRGNPMDYNNWATKYGLSNFSWNNVLEYFLLWENNTDSAIRQNGLHNNMGPVSVSTVSEPDPVLLNFMQTMNVAGLSTVDINGPSQVGTAIAQMFWNYNAIKSTTANAYIETTNRTNLAIVTRAFVTGVLTTNNGARAAGVQYRDLRTGNTMVAFANQEVILSAGTINTPQVLMLSGIGPSDHLNQLGIGVVRDLPVGNNLHDMVMVPMYYRITNQSRINPIPYFVPTNQYRYFVHATGPLAQHADGVTYYSSSLNPNTTWPDTMIITIVEYFDDLDSTVAQYAQNRDQWRAFWKPYNTSVMPYYLAVDPVLARPKSRGTVRLNVSDPTGAPLVDPRYLSHPDDFQALVEVARFAGKAIRNYPIPYVEEFPRIPGCDNQPKVECYVRQLSRSYYNFVGTARMGVTGDSNAVVDPNFRVMGFENLRVVDASVIPEVPNAHINAAVIMLAEKAARVIMTGQ